MIVNVREIILLVSEKAFKFVFAVFCWKIAQNCLQKVEIVKIFEILSENLFEIGKFW